MCQLTYRQWGCYAHGHEHKNDRKSVFAEGRCPYAIRRNLRYCNQLEENMEKPVKRCFSHECCDKILRQMLETWARYRFGYLRGEQNGRSKELGEQAMKAVKEHHKNCNFNEEVFCQARVEVIESYGFTTKTKKPGVDGGYIW